MTSSTGQAYNRFTIGHAVMLAAPHTWPASVLPVAFTACIVMARGIPLSVSLAIVLLIICVAMQSAVNAFNDYMDFRKGTDSVDDDVDPSDAVLVYENVDPRCALAFAIGCIACAFLLGTYCICMSGWIPLVIALVGALIVFLYSGGRTPISYLPIGELVSGFVMGGLIPLGCWSVLAGAIDWMVLVWSIPLMMGIGLIMMTNNGCDIPKDIEAGRRTLPVLLGHGRTVALYHGVIVVWYIACIAVVAVWFTEGAIILPFMVLITYPFAKALWGNPLTADTRIKAMSQVLTLNVALGGFLCLSVAVSMATMAL